MAGLDSLPCTIRPVEHTREHTFAESLKARMALLSTKAMLLPRTLVRQQFASKLIERQAPLTLMWLDWIRSTDAQVEELTSL